MGSKGSGGTNTVTSNSAPPPQVMANYTAVTGQAQNVAATPYQAYTGQEVAPLNAQQTAAGTEAANAVGSYQPYFNQAQGMIANGTQAITPSAVNASTIGQYESPYNQDVINATEAQMNQNDQTQQQQLTGNAIAAGAFGGDRQAVAASTLAGQQDLANNSTIAGLENSNYTQALGEANTQQQTGMTAQQATAANQLQASGLTGALGNYASTNNLNEASANEAAGQAAQLTTQAQDTAAYQQFQQQLAYPFQTTGWLAGIDTGVGGASGGTSSTVSPGTPLAGQIAGLGVTGLGIYGAATSTGAKRGGPIRGYAGGGGIPDFSISYVPGSPSFGGGSTMLKPSGESSTTTGGPSSGISGVTNNAGVLSLAGKGIKSLMGPSAGTVSGAPGSSISTGLSASGDQGLITGSNVPASGGVSIGGANVGAYTPADIFGSGFSAAPSSAAGDIMWDNPAAAAGIDSSIAGSFGMGDALGASADTMGALYGGVDAADAAMAAAATDAGVEAGAADLGESALAADAADTIAFAKRGGPIKGYASGGSLSAPSYPLAYLLGNPSLGSNMNSTMGSGYGGALSGMGASSAGYSSGGGIAPKKYYNGGSGSDLTGGEPSGWDGWSNYQVSPIGGNVSLPPSGGAFGGNSNANVMPNSPDFVKSYVPTVPSLTYNNPMSMGASDAVSPSTGISGTSADSSGTSTDNAGTTSIAGVPALGSSTDSTGTSDQPESLAELEAKLNKNAPVLDKNTAMIQAGLAMMGGTSHNAITNIAQGAAQGVNDYAAQKQAVRDYGLKEAEVEDRAKQMQVEADRFKQQIQYQNAELNQGQQRIDQGKYSTQPGYGPDASGNQVPGVYRINTKTNEAPQFIPGVVTSAGIGRSPIAQTEQQIKNEHPEYSAEQTATAATNALATGTQQAKTNAAAEQSLQHGVGSDLAKTQKQWTDAATTSQLANNYIDQMKNETDQFRLGWGAQTQRSGKQVLQGLSNALGVDTPDMDKALGSQQAFNKTAMQMVMDKTRSVSSRAAYSEMQSIQSGMPTEAMSQNGFDTVTSQMRGVNDYTKALAKTITDPAALDSYKVAHNGSISGFDNDVLNKVSPAVFWLKNMNPADRTTVLRNMKSNDPSTYASLQAKTKYAVDNGLLQ